EVFLVHGASTIEAAGADEFDDLPQLLAIEPDAVTAADIDDDAGAAGELGRCHELVALRTGDVAAFWRILVAGDGDGEAQYGGLLFAVGANLLESGRVHPDAAAFFAIAELNVADVEILQRNSAARAMQERGIDGSWRGE